MIKNLKSVLVIYLFISVSIVRGQSIQKIDDKSADGKYYNTDSAAIQTSYKDSISNENLSKIYLLGVAGGFKYEPNISIRKFAPFFMLSFMVNTNNKRTSFFGVELNYYGEGRTNRENIKNIFYLTPFYQWNPIHIKKLYLTMQFGITVLSNNPVHFLTNSLDVGLQYRTSNFFIVAKHSFLINYFLASNFLSVTNIGVYLRL